MRKQKATPVGQPDIFVDLTPAELAQRAIDEQKHLDAIPREEWLAARKKAYAEEFNGGIVEQLDYIFHNDVDAWKLKVQAAKDRTPKPEGL